MKPLTREHLGWRSRPGILGKHPSSPQSVHALLGSFLKDRHSPTPFPGRDMLANEGLFDWGIASPLEKVIDGPEHTKLLLEVPELYRSIFICLDRQLTAATHVQLIKRATREVPALTRLPLDPAGRTLSVLQKLSKQIVEVGEHLPIMKNGAIIATGWGEPDFAVARNEAVEVGTRKLLPYARHGHHDHVPEMLQATHALIADEL